MRKSLKCLLLTISAMLFVVSAHAQVTTSALSGRVTDANGEPVVGAAVVAVHVPSGTTYGVITNAEGRYIINGMRAGSPYSVEVSCLGYNTVSYTEVALQLAETTTINAKLADASEYLNEVIVLGESKSKLVQEKTGAATNITSSQITNLPTVSRSITDVTRLSPYGGNGMAFAGSDGRTANFTVDGANFNNNFGLSDKLPGGGSPISIDAIDELQVVISPYDVRQTNFIGGGVNAVTKSGTNTFKGTAYVYHKDERLRGAKIEGDPIKGARDIDRNTTYGFTLGGPIIKNKLFFFVNAEYSQIPTVVNRWQASEDGVMDPDNYTSRTTIEDLQRVKDFVAEKYGYDTGSFTEFPANESNMKMLARIDWNISDKHKLAVRYNYTLNQNWQSTNATSMDGGTRGTYGRFSKGAMSYANSLYSLQNLVNTASVDLNSRLSDNLSNQFLATFSKLDDIRGTNSTPFPFIDIQKDGDNYIALGYELFTWNNAVHNTVITAKDDLTYYAGTHKLTAGVSYEYQMADNAYMRNGTGYYRYSSVDDFISGAAPEVVCLTYGYDGEQNPAARVRFHKAGAYVQDEWNPSEQLKLTAGLRLDGLFFDNQDLVRNQAIYDINTKYAYIDAEGNEQIVAHANQIPEGFVLDHEVVDNSIYGGRRIDTGAWPKNSITVSPRLGFTYDVLGDHSLKVRGGTGLFSGRLPLVFFTNMPTNSGMVQYAAQINAKNAAAKGFAMDAFAGGLVVDENGNPTIAALLDKLIGLGYPSTISPEDGTIPSAVNGVDPTFKMPQVWKTSVAFDYSVPVSFPLTVTAEGIFNKTINGVAISDWSILNAASFYRLNGADSRPVYPASFRSGTKAFVLENTNKGYGWSANLTVNATPVKGLNIMAAYTHTVSKEITGMPGSAAESAFTYVPTSEGPNHIKLHNSQYVTPDRFVASVNYNTKYDHIGLIWEAWRGGYNYSYMLTNDMNADGYNYDALYIPTDAQIANGEFRFASEDDRDRFLGYIKNDSYLRNHRGQYAEAYSVYSPWVNRIDLSYKHDFKVKIGQNTNTLQLSLDVKNLLNLFNSSWGVSKQMNPDITEGRILKFNEIDADGVAVFSTPAAVSGDTKIWTPVHAIGQCWYASVGIKYLFN